MKSQAFEVSKSYQLFRSLPRVALPIFVLLLLIASNRVVDHASGSKEERLEEWAGFRHAWSNLRWMQILADSRVERVPLGQRAPIYLALKDLIETDPYFYEPYRYSSTVLGIVLDDAEAAREILQQAVDLRLKGRVPEELFQAGRSWSSAWELNVHLGFFLALELGQVHEGVRALQQAVAWGAPLWVEKFSKDLLTPVGSLRAYSEWLALQVRISQRDPRLGSAQAGGVWREKKQRVDLMIELAQMNRRFGAWLRGNAQRPSTTNLSVFSTFYFKRVHGLLSSQAVRWDSISGMVDLAEAVHWVGFEGSQWNRKALLRQEFLGEELNSQAILDTKGAPSD